MNSHSTSYVTRLRRRPIGWLFTSGSAPPVEQIPWLRRVGAVPDVVPELFARPVAWRACLTAGGYGGDFVPWLRHVERVWVDPPDVPGAVSRWSPADYRGGYGGDFTPWLRRRDRVWVDVPTDPGRVLLSQRFLRHVAADPPWTPLDDTGFAQQATGMAKARLARMDSLWAVSMPSMSKVGSASA